MNMFNIDLQDLLYQKDNRTLGINLSYSMFHILSYSLLLPLIHEKCFVKIWNNFFCK